MIVWTDLPKGGLSAEEKGCGDEIGCERGEEAEAEPAGKADGETDGTDQQHGKEYAITARLPVPGAERGRDAARRRTRLRAAEDEGHHPEARGPHPGAGKEGSESGQLDAVCGRVRGEQQRRLEPATGRGVAHSSPTTTIETHTKQSSLLQPERWSSDHVYFYAVFNRYIRWNQMNDNDDDGRV